MIRPRSHSRNRLTISGRGHYDVLADTLPGTQMIFHGLLKILANYYLV